MLQAAQSSHQVHHRFTHDLQNFAKDSDVPDLIGGMQKDLVAHDEAYPKAMEHLRSGPERAGGEAVGNIVAMHRPPYATHYEIGPQYHEEVPEIRAHEIVANKHELAASVATGKMLSAASELVKTRAAGGNIEAHHNEFRAHHRDVRDHLSKQRDALDGMYAAPFSELLPGGGNDLRNRVRDHDAAIAALPGLVDPDGASGSKEDSVSGNGASKEGGASRKSAAAEYRSQATQTEPQAPSPAKPRRSKRLLGLKRTKA